MAFSLVLYSLRFLRRDAMHSAFYAVARCLFVRLSVTRRYSVETVIRILKLFHRQVATPF